MSETQEFTELVEEAPAVQEDYFNFGGERTHVLPDGISEIYFRVMNEGQKATYQRNAQRSFTIKKGGDAEAKMDPVRDRISLLEAAVTGWNLVRGGRPYPFTPRAFKDFLDLANPVVVDGLEKAIRKANPWLLQDLSVEDIDREIADLQEMREAAVERERGE